MANGDDRFHNQRATGRKDKKHGLNRDASEEDSVEKCENQDKGDNEDNDDDDDSDQNEHLLVETEIRRFEEMYNPFKKTGTWFGSLKNEVVHRYVKYASDITDGFSLSCLIAFVFMFTLCIAPALCFGGILGTSEGSTPRFISIFFLRVCLRDLSTIFSNHASKK